MASKLAEPKIFQVAYRWSVDSFPFVAERSVSRASSDNRTSPESRKRITSSIRPRYSIPENNENNQRINIRDNSTIKTFNVRELDY